MNCSTFRKKLYDYTRENMVNDLKEAMDKHMEECETCRSLYEEEVRIDEILRDAFQAENIEFTSSRAAIMKNIDRDKYVKPKANKISYHISQHKMKYISTAAVLLVTFVMLPYMMQGMGGAKKKSESMNIAADTASKAQMPKADTAKSVAQGAQILETPKPQQEAQDNVSQQDLNKTMGMPKDTLNKRPPKKPGYVPKFQRQDRKEELKPEDMGSWKASPNGKLEAVVAGKGKDVQQFGIGSIVINNKETNKKIDLSLLNNEIDQNTPMFIEWFDNENLLVVVGYGYDPQAVGGDLYIININNCKTATIYETKNESEEVMTVKKKDSTLEMKVRVYENANLTAHHDEDRGITFKDVTDNKQLPEVSSVYAFADYLNKDDSQKAEESMTVSFLASYRSKLGELKDIQSMNIKRIIDATGDYTADSTIKQNKGYKIFYALIAYTIDDKSAGTLKSGEYYQKIVIVKETEESAWKISDFVLVPQK